MDYERLHEILPKKYQNWTVENVATWLRFLHLEAVIPKFSFYQIDGKELKFLTEQILQRKIQISSKIILKKLLAWLYQGLDEYNQHVIQKDYDGSSEVIEEQSCFDVSNEIGTGKSSFSDQFARTGKNYLNKKRKELILKRIESDNHSSYRLDGSATIGRNCECDILIEDQDVDRFHCQVIFDEVENEFYLRNLSKRIGPFLKIEKSFQIQNNTLLELGSNHFLFKVQQNCLYIEVIDGQNFGEKFVLEKQPFKNFKVGRKSTCRVGFSTDNHLSNLHGNIYYACGKWIYEDLQTTNGSWCELRQKVLLTNEVKFKVGSKNSYQCQLFENKKIPLKKDESLKCQKCQQNDKNIIFQPCKHLLFCEACSEDEKECKICHQKIFKKMKIFMC